MESVKACRNAVYEVKREIPAYTKVHNSVRDIGGLKQIRTSRHSRVVILVKEKSND